MIAMISARFSINSGIHLHNFRHNDIVAGVPGLFLPPLPTDKQTVFATLRSDEAYNGCCSLVTITTVQMLQLWTSQLRNFSLIV
jgi:hypothetical protein